MSNLTAYQQSVLANSFIPQDISAEAQYRGFTDIEGAELLGRKPTAGVNYSGFGKPVFSPYGQKHPRGWVYRVDNPEKEKTLDGKIKLKNKYLRPKGEKNMLDFQPGVVPEMLEDVMLDAIYCETSKGMLSVYRLSKLVGREWLSIGQTGGCWGFRGKVEKITDEHGARQDVKGTIPDIFQINWQNRKVTIVYDADTKTNPKVKNAQNTLANTLQELGAEVHILTLPAIDEKASIDDVLGFWEREHGTEKAAELGLKLIESAKPFQNSSERKSIVEKLIDLSEDLEFFHTANLESYAIVPINSHFENIKINSKEFRAYLSRLCWENERKAISGQSMQDVINVLQSKALFDSPQIETHIRYAAHGDDIYIDLGNESWNSVKVSPSGWQFVESKDIPVKFRRSRGLLPLPTPSFSTNYESLSRFINIREDDFILLCAWIVAAMRPDFPCPVLALYGGQGTGKSTTTEILRSLIDPNVSALRSKPRDERDLMIAARNGWVLSFDNLSQISHEFSDSLCRLVTGGGFAVRELYSDDAETIFDAKRPVIINGISDLASRSDLLERCLLITLPVIEETKRKDEKTFQAELAEAKPILFAAFLNKLSVALSEIDNVKLAKVPRMADFAKFAYAAFGQEFIEKYDSNRSDAHETALENSPVAETLLKFLEGLDRGSWEGTASQLLDALENVAGDKTKGSKSFPKAANKLSSDIARIAPNLPSKGWKYERRKDGHTRTRISIFTKLDDTDKPSSASSANHQTHNKNNSLRADDTADDRNIADDTFDFADDTVFPNRPHVNQENNRFNNGADDADSADDTFHSYSNGRNYSTNEREEFEI